MHKFRYGGYTFGSNSSQAYIDAILAYNADAAVELLSINGNNVASSDPLRMQDSQKIRNSSELKEAISRLKQLQDGRTYEKLQIELQYRIEGAENLSLVFPKIPQTRTAPGSINQKAQSYLAGMLSSSEPQSLHIHLSNLHNYEKPKSIDRSDAIKWLQQLSNTDLSVGIEIAETKTIVFCYKGRSYYLTYGQNVEFGHLGLNFDIDDGFTCAFLDNPNANDTPHAIARSLYKYYHRWKQRDYQGEILPASFALNMSYGTSERVHDQTFVDGAYAYSAYPSQHPEPGQAMGTGQGNSRGTVYEANFSSPPSNHDSRKPPSSPANSHSSTLLPLSVEAKLVVDFSHVNARIISDGSWSERFPSSIRILVPADIIDSVINDLRKTPGVTKVSELAARPNIQDMPQYWGNLGKVTQDEDDEDELSQQVQAYRISDNNNSSNYAYYNSGNTFFRVGNMVGQNNSGSVSINSGYGHAPATQSNTDPTFQTLKITYAATKLPLNTIDPRIIIIVEAKLNENTSVVKCKVPVEVYHEIMAKLYGNLKIIDMEKVTEPVAQKTYGYGGRSG